jgi:hypothetical protein
VTRQILKWVAQAVAFTAFMALLGYASTQPAYHHRDPTQSQILVSFSHAGVRAEDCRPLTPEEMALAATRDAPPNASAVA